MHDALETNPIFAPLDLGQRQALLGLMPFRGTEAAALVFHNPLLLPRWPQDNVVVFVIADLHVLGRGLGDLVWHAYGYDRPAREIGNFLNSLRHFVAKFRGVPLSGSVLAGRKPGRDINYQEVQTTYWELADKRDDGKRPRQLDVAERLNVEEWTVQRVCRDERKRTGQRVWPPSRPQNNG
jgi:hypothetical protein